MAEKSYSINLDASKVKSTNISRYSDGYNYASVTAKMNDSEYMSVSYEWKGTVIPEFALMTMEIMKFAGAENANLTDSDVFERAAVHFTEMAAKAKDKKDKKDWFTKCPKCGKMGDKCICKDKEEKSKTIPVEDEEDMEECAKCGKMKEECKCKPKKK